jgi:hypothetical protein
VRAPALLLLIALTATTTFALYAKACEICREDKIAATYDYGVVSAAKRRGHTVVFTAIAGRLTPGDTAPARVVAKRLAAVPGVDAGTVRTSLTPPAASFACDPSRGAASRVAAANRALAGSGLSLTIVQIGAPGEAPVMRAAR